MYIFTMYNVHIYNVLCTYLQCTMYIFTIDIICLLVRDRESEGFLKVYCKISSRYVARFSSRDVHTVARFPEGF